MAMRQITGASGARVQTIINPNRGQLAALVRQEKLARRIDNVHSEIVRVPGKGTPLYAVKVIRLKDQPSPWRKRGAITAGVMSASGALCWMVWDARYIIGSALLLAAALAFVWWLASLARGHSAGCSGYHCPGCRG